jgi:hypothetical protein
MKDLYIIVKIEVKKRLLFRSPDYWWSGMKLESQPTIILDVLAAKMPDKENNRILVQTGSMSVISGQHFQLDHANYGAFSLKYRFISTT